jgi:hypothetical protein
MEHDLPHDEQSLEQTQTIASVEYIHLREHIPEDNPLVHKETQEEALRKKHVQKHSNIEVNLDVQNDPK